MPRSQGFARGDLDTSFPLDDKFLALRGKVSIERYYAATGVYFHVAAATWREAERKQAAKVCPDAEEIIADLQSVGLLDADGCVSRRAFANTVGRAKRARRTSTERKARNRAEKSRGTERDGRGTDGDPDLPRSVGPVTDPPGTESSRARDDDPWAAPEQPALAYLASVGATVMPNGNGFHRRLVMLVERRGVDAVVEALKRRHAAGDRSDRQLIFGAENDLETVVRGGKDKPAAGHHAQSVEEVDRAFRH